MKRSVLAAAVSVALATTACGTDGDSAGADGLTVVATLYPVAYLVERIGGDRVAVENLVPPGQEPHDLELSLAKVAELSDSDLVVYLEGFQPAVDDAVETNGPDRSLDVHEAADLLTVEEEHDEGHEESEESEDHDHAGEDPHFWLDPARMAAVAAAIEAELAEADPAGAEEFATNAAAVAADLERLDRAYAEGLASCELDTVVVSHDAFGYLTRFGPEFYGISGLSPETEPSLAKIQELSDLIEDDGITTVFYERLVSPELSDALAERLDLETAVLDTIEGLSDETADEDYVSLMESNLAALQQANGCS